MALRVLWCICMNHSGRWEKSRCEINFHGCGGGVRCQISAAVHVAALDSDWFGHVHAKQGAEGVRLWGAHAGDSSGLDAVSTWYWTLRSRSQCQQHQTLRWCWSSIQVSSGYKHNMWVEYVVSRHRHAEKSKITGRFGFSLSKQVTVKFEL